MAIRLALVGLGKIAHDQHIPALASSADFELVCGASLQGRCPVGATYETVEAMLEAEQRIEAVALCQPPQVRFQAAQAALAAGKHVLLEKPPAASVCEVEILADMAARRGLTLFTAWHSRYAAAVEPARLWLERRRVVSGAVTWREDVRRWHPGQRWIWRPGGFGVFDPGINALSILTHILPPLRIVDAALSFPSNQEAPIAAELGLALPDGTPVVADFDFRQTGEQIWRMRFDTDSGVLELHAGGARLTIDGVEEPLPAQAEYPALYDRFAALIAQDRSEVDALPLQLTADAFMRGGRRIVEAFEDTLTGPAAGQPGPEAH